MSVTEDVSHDEMSWLNAVYSNTSFKDFRFETSHSEMNWGVLPSSQEAVLEVLCVPSAQA